MQLSRSFPIIESSSTAARLDAAVALLRPLSPSQSLTIVAATRGAADEFARRLAVERGATVGLARFSLTQLAARLAAPALAGGGIAPATALGSEAVAARVAFETAGRSALSYFADVASMPGFARALAHTVADLRGAATAASQLAEAGAGAADLSRLVAAAEREHLVAATADRARLFAAAGDAIADDPLTAAPLVLLDIPLDSVVEARFASRLILRAPHVVATVPEHDASARQALTAAGGIVQRVTAAVPSSLGRAREFLFAERPPAEAALDPSLQFFSAPGEGREAVEIARRILTEARRGVAFDDMAILLRAPQHYQGLLEHALTRAGVPASFERGTSRPHPAGRAYLALLACADEALSARRFAEYLSLGQLPEPNCQPVTWTPAQDEAVALPEDAGMVRLEAGPTHVEAGVPGLSEVEGSRPDRPGAESDAELAGTLRTPRRWERLLVEASVIGGGPDRWARRLDGLAAELRHRLTELGRDESQSARADGVTRDLERLAHLRAFVMPLIEELASWPASATWGEWIVLLEAIAPRVLRAPAYVLRVLADLKPMAVVGPVTIGEVRAVLADRLRVVHADPPSRRYGRVFVGSPAQARGRAFRVVFLPGLAERMFPQKPRQDPLLGDAARIRVDSRLTTRVEQGRRERLLLHLALGAATERLYVSYPRLDVAEGRPRVPSFYALDVMRGATGRIPDHDALAAAAAEAGDPSLAWPAPAEAGLAIDAQEHDLAVLRRLLDARDPASVRGHAQYILKLSPALRRSVTDRWARAEKRWTQYDGITRAPDAIREALTSQRLGARRYSLSALQRFAACPYQFLLGAIYRLVPAEEPLPLRRLDPLTKGSLVHAIQAAFFRDLAAAGALPITPASRDVALHALDAAVDSVGRDYEEKLAPAIMRVWRDELASIARDLRGWVRQNAEAPDGWIPRYFELAFGLPGDPGRDLRSEPDPVTVDGRYVLRGSVDLVEEDASGATLRVTDHKTGRDRHKEGVMIGGGEVLQPVLYSLVVEQFLHKPVIESRLSFCTSAGGYKVRTVRLTPEARRAGIEALEIIDRAVERGTLAAAPRKDACRWCDFRPVCGPNEEARTSRKPADWIADLIELRSRP